MARPAKPEMRESLERGDALALLAEIDHPDGYQRLWTGVGTLWWNEYNWRGLGRLIGVSPISYSSELAIQELAFTMTGVPPDRATWISSNVRNRQAIVYFAAIKPNGRVARDPIQVVDALLDNQVLVADDAGTVTVKINARTGFYTLERNIDLVWSPENQKIKYAADTGLDGMSLLLQNNVRWAPT